MSTEIRAYYSAPRRAIEIYIESQDRIIVQPLVESLSFREPACFLDARNSGQVLMDDLWACGIRPTEGQGSAGALTATQDHLKDLQRIVFKDYIDKK